MDSSSEARRRSPAPFIIGGVVVFVAGIGGLGALVFVGILAGIAIPNFVLMQLRSKRAEVPATVEGIKTAELAYDAAFDGFVPAGSAEEAKRHLGAEPHAWIGDAGFERLRWRPEGEVRGGYWVVVTGEGTFEVHGVCDVDGDGEYAEYDGNRWITPPDVY